MTRISALLLALFLALPGVCQAQVIAITWTGEIILFDPVTGVAGQAGSNSTYNWNAMAKTAGGDVVVANDHNPASLFRIDPVTFEFHTIAAGTPDIRSLAGHPVVDGLYYAIASGFGDRLYEIDDTSGPTVVTYLGEIPIGGLQSLAFDDLGVLYGYSSYFGLVEVDIANVLSSNVSGLIDGLNGIQALSFHDGVLYGIGQSIWEIDRTTGARTFVSGGTLGDIRGAEFVPGLAGMFTICDATPNSTGGSPTFTQLGTLSISNNDLRLRAFDVPPGQFAFLLVGTQTGSLPIGDGNLCLGTGNGQPYRVLPPKSSNMAGALNFPIDLNSAPFSTYPGLVQPGSALLFQAWYRDPAGPGGSNLTSAVGLFFLP